MSTSKTIKLKNLRVANPDYNARTARQCSVVAVILVALLKTGVL